ncbi:MAG: TIGR03667 family PPOX class F420-dependent oxidoreductase [Actinomycetota bacterium]
MPEVDASTAKRLADELIVWLTSVRSDGQPQSVPVWFIWEDGSFLIFSQRDKPKLRNIAGNPRVALHLRGTDTGGDVVVFEGTARHPADEPRADQVERYVEKYREQIDGLGWTPESFGRDYSEPIRVTPSTVRTW